MYCRILVRFLTGKPVFAILFGLVAGIHLSNLTTAHAFQFSSGELQGSLDTTLSFGVSLRTEDPDSRIIGIANGGSAYSVNADDGNLNYDTGIISSVAKITSELDLSFRDRLGAFFRGTAFYDFENENGNREKDPLRDEAKDLVGSDADLLDAYLWTNFDLGALPVQLRVGEQVVSWGESTFIQNSINAINPVNVNAIRLPGSELKEALLPEGLVWGSIGTSENTSLEAFYLYDWGETVIDPPGSYWSSNDFVGEGGERLMLGWGDVAEGSFLGVPRSKTNFADDSGQFGLAFRAYVPKLNGTEFGFFFMKYHSRLPIISARTGTLGGAMEAGLIGAQTPVIIGQVIAAGGNPATATANAVAAGLDPTTAGTIAGASALGFAAGGAAGAVAAGGKAGTAFATNAFSKTASYYTEYPEDIKLYGVSFNTELTASGIALQGEVSHRQNVPLQIDDIEVLFAALSPLGATGAGQLGVYGLSTNIPGYVEKDVTQAQVTATKVFGPTLGADQFLIVGEAAITYVHSMPNKSDLRLNGPGTYVSGNPAQGPVSHPGKPIESSSHFADANSWGYRLVTKMDFNNAIGATTLSPRISWRHDVNGISPGPGGNFLEGRKAISFGLGANYLDVWTFDISYANFFGAGRYNLINDRDIVSANIKYSF